MVRISDRKRAVIAEDWGGRVGGWAVRRRGVGSPEAEFLRNVAPF